MRVKNNFISEATQLYHVAIEPWINISRVSNVSRIQIVNNFNICFLVLTVEIVALTTANRYACGK
jgi:hypothetical protein